MRFTPAVAAAIVLTGLSAAPQHALAAPATSITALSPESAALVARATAYLSSLTSAKGRFTQTGAHGAVLTGTFMIQRPGRARFAYDPPSGLTIASDGRLVSVLDTRLRTFQNYPLGMTPLALFLARDVRLDRGVVVDEVRTMAGGFAITARDGRKAAQGHIVLTFADHPMALTGWTITDGGGQSTQVRLSDFARAGPFPAKLFDLRNPWREAPPSGMAGQ